MNAASTASAAGRNPVASAGDGVNAESKRFTIDGDCALEALLEKGCERVLDRVRRIVPADRLEALLLGGGYGRGEGGVWRGPGGDQPYNDLEFYVCARGPRLIGERRWGQALRESGHALGAELGIEVEFKLISLAELGQAAPSMFYCDLVAGHRWLTGDESMLDRCKQQRHPERLPLSEGSRLLMNRCTGLLLARERLDGAQWKEADADFVYRNIAKARLAVGDAVLVAEGLYHPSVLERSRRLTGVTLDVPWMDAVRRLHAAGVEFKLHPGPGGSKAQLRSLHEEVAALAYQVWIWIESRRLGRGIGGAVEYATGPWKLCPEFPWWRNWLITAVRKGLGRAVRPWATRHPRERVMRALALLLWEPKACERPELAGFLKRLLAPGPGPGKNWMDAYVAWWRLAG